jgi:hypothetical protein
VARMSLDRRSFRSIVTGRTKNLETRTGDICRNEGTNADICLN